MNKELTAFEDYIVTFHCTNKSNISLRSLRNKLVVRTKLVFDIKYKFHAPKIIKHMLPLLSTATNLDVSGTTLTHDTLLFDGLPKTLIRLDISRTGVDQGNIDHLMQIIKNKGLPNLTSLNCAGNNLTEHGTAIMASVLSQTKISTLDVSDIGVSASLLIHALSPKK